MAIADPKDYTTKAKADPKDEPVVETKGLSIGDLVAALKAATGNDDASMRRRAEYEAEARARLAEAEDEKKVHPHISVYSHPEGDIARPKPPLQCETFWVGYPLEIEQLTPAEVDLLNEIQPGDYMFTRADESRTAMAVVGERDNAGRLHRKLITFACRGDDAKNLPSMVMHLRSALGKKSRVDELEAELASLRAQVAVPA